MSEAVRIIFYLGNRFRPPLVLGELLLAVVSRKSLTSAEKESGRSKEGGEACLPATDHQHRDEQGRVNTLPPMPNSTRGDNITHPLFGEPLSKQIFSRNQNGT